MINWPEIPLGRNTNTDSCLQENRREADTVWAMFKKDPLSPVTAYWKNYGMPGMGLFLEGYVVCNLNAVLLHVAVVSRPQFIHVQHKRPVITVTVALEKILLSAICNQLRLQCRLEQ